jgi:hypothetical protein
MATTPAPRSKETRYSARVPYCHRITTVLSFSSHNVLSNNYSNRREAAFEIRE